jgi:hypothetical protein
MKGKKLFLYSLGSLAVLSATAVSAQEIATAPSLEGGWSGMLGGFLFVPSTNDQAYDIINNQNEINDSDATYLNSYTVNDNFDYDTGWQAAIGYVFDNTANGIELSYRSFNSSQDFGPTGPQTFDDVVTPIFEEGTFNSKEGIYANTNNQYQNWDLMISQFLDIGTHVQMRFLGGLSYLSDLKQTRKNNVYLESGTGVINGDFTNFSDVDVYEEASSKYSGLGPRIGIDARYDFGEDLAGFGIVGGASLAYFLGDLKNDLNSSYKGCYESAPPPPSVAQDCTGEGVPLPFDTGYNATDQNDNHAVTNLRANLGIDYVYYFEDQDLPTLGLELGYEVDTFLNGIGSIAADGSEVAVSDVTFSGPYLNLKGVF